ncbi:phage major capsid protein [Candidatus Pacearchaeota archaeon]|jgi:uncharacterized protein (DUF2384 family)|nr:phage major capsid protein [Candidatus Pacearchaeota archaeon]
MASITFVEAAKLCQDELVSGLIENVITVNPFYNILPFDSIDGNGLTYNREDVLGDVQVAGVGDTITAKNATTFTSVTSVLTSILGDAEVNGLVQATQSGETNQTAQQIASKTKTASRKYQDMLINGTGAGNEFLGLLGLVPSAQKVPTGATGMNLSFGVLDTLMHLVVSKDGQVDYMLMPARTIRAYKALLRALGGAGVNEVMEMPNGARVIAYEGVPIFRNDYIPTNQTKGGYANCTTIFAGCIDDGSRKVGLTGLTARNAYGLEVEQVGVHQTKDERIWRVKWYCGLALFSQLGVASADGIRD